MVQLGTPGATLHTAHATMAHLCTLFENRIWILQVKLEWSRQNLDRAPLFLLGCCKAEVYKEKPCSLRQLKQAVEAFIQSVTTDTCRRVIENFTSMSVQTERAQCPILKT